MKKEKIPFYEKFDPVELWMWQNKKHFGGLKDYRASEGKEVEINYKGNIKNTLQDLLGSIRSTCTYIGATRLKDMHKCATFVRVNRQVNTFYK